MWIIPSQSIEFKLKEQVLVFIIGSNINCGSILLLGKTYSLMSNDGMSVRVMYQCFKAINCDNRHKYMVNLYTLFPPNFNVFSLRPIKWNLVTITTSFFRSRVHTCRFTKKKYTIYWMKQGRSNYLWENIQKQVFLHHDWILINQYWCSTSFWVK